MSGLANFYDRMNYYISAKLHKINLSGIVVRATVTIHNPTDTNVKLSKPTVRIYSGEVEIGHSPPENKTIEVLEHAVSKIENIEITLPWSIELLKLVGGVGQKVALIAAGADEPIGIKVTIKALMDVNGINDIVQTSEVTL